MTSGGGPSGTGPRAARSAGPRPSRPPGRTRGDEPPSGEKAREKMRSCRSINIRTQAPERIPQSRMSPSSPPVARVFPSGEKAMTFTGSLCPSWINSSGRSVPAPAAVGPVGRRRDRRQSEKEKHRRRRSRAEEAPPSCPERFMDRAPSEILRTPGAWAAPMRSLPRRPSAGRSFPSR